MQEDVQSLVRSVLLTAWNSFKQMCILIINVVARARLRSWTQAANLSSTQLHNSTGCNELLQINRLD